MFWLNFWVLLTVLDILVNQQMKGSLLEYLRILHITMHIVGKDVYYDEDSRSISRNVASLKMLTQDVINLYYILYHFCFIKKPLDFSFLFCWCGKVG